MSVMDSRACVTFWLKLCCPGVFLWDASTCKAGSGAVVFAGSAVEDPTSGSRSVTVDLSVEDRRGNPQAKAAFFWAARQNLPKDFPECFPCGRCGKPTLGWCEGCYRHIAETLPFSAICQDCDRAHLVCDQCQAARIDWETGHRSFLETHPEEDEETFEVTVVLRMLHVFLYDIHILNIPENPFCPPICWVLLNHPNTRSLLEIKTRVIKGFQAMNLNEFCNVNMTWMHTS